MHIRLGGNTRPQHFCPLSLPAANFNNNTRISAPSPFCINTMRKPALLGSAKGQLNEHAGRLHVLASRRWSSHCGHCNLDCSIGPKTKSSLPLHPTSYTVLCGLFSLLVANTCSHLVSSFGRILRGFFFFSICLLFCLLGRAVDSW